MNAMKRVSPDAAVLAFLLASILFVAGCDEKQTAPPVPSQVQTGPSPALLAQEKAAEEKAAAEEKKRAEAEEKAALEKSAASLSTCCLALAKEGFEKRSMEFMAAKKVCNEALEKKQELSAALGSIEKELDSKPLPSECQAK